jgi:hypothetical protein
MRPTTLAALALLAPLSVARAADPTTTIGSSTVTLSMTSGSADFGYGDCKDTSNTAKTATFTATCSKPVPSGTTLYIWLTTDSTCPTPSGGKSISDSDNSVTTTLNARNITDTSTSDCPTKVTKEKYVCVVAKTSSQTSTAASLKVTYHSEPPDTPTLQSAVGGDEAVHLKWSTTGTIDYVKVLYRQLTEAPDSGVDICHRPAAVDAGSTGVASSEFAATEATDAGDASDGSNEDGGTADGGVASAGDGGTADAGYDESQFLIKKSTSTSGDVVSGLKNGATYLFFVKAVDQYGNESGQSEAMEVTPQLVQDFARRYRCLGGQEMGGFGCTSAGAAALVPAFGALAFAALRRRGGRRP